MGDQNKDKVINKTNGDDATFEWMDLARDLIDLTNVTITIIVRLLLGRIKHFNKRSIGDDVNNDNNDDTIADNCSD